MLKTVLIPLDGSAESEQALITAGPLARRSGATIMLAQVHVPILNVYMGSWNMGGVPIVDETLDNEQHDREESYLQAVHDRLVKDGYAVSYTLLDGPIAATLIDYIAATHPDLVVMTTHGHGALSRLWLGSVADRLVRHCGAPTLLVRPLPADELARQERSRPNTTHRILIPLDGSSLAEQIIEPACTVGELLAAEYYLVRIVQPLDASTWSMGAERPDLQHEQLRSRRSEAQAYLAGIASRLRNAGNEVHTHVEVAEQPARALIDLAESYAADMIALATHGHGGLQRLLLGSVADKLIRSVQLPVLVLHPQPTPADVPDTPS